MLRRPVQQAWCSQADAGGRSARGDQLGAAAERRRGFVAGERRAGVLDAYTSLVPAAVGGPMIANPNVISLRGRRTDKRGFVSSALFPYTVLSYQNAGGVRYTPPRSGRQGR